MKKNSILVYIVLLFAGAFFSSCSKEEEEHLPEFNLELSQLLHYNWVIMDNDVIGLSICVSEEDVKYLKMPYTLSIEMLGWTEINLVDAVLEEDGSVSYLTMDEMNSVGSDLEPVNKFHDDFMMKNNYAAYSDFLVKGKDVYLSSFRLKFDFYEISATYYSREYTIRGYKLEDGKFVYWLIPGVCKR